MSLLTWEEQFGTAVFSSALEESVCQIVTSGFLQRLKLCPVSEPQTIRAESKTKAVFSLGSLSCFPKPGLLCLCAERGTCVPVYRGQRTTFLRTFHTFLWEGEIIYFLRISHWPGPYQQAKLSGH